MNDTIARSIVTVDVVIFTVEKGELKALLVRRTKAPFAGAMALPGAFLRKGETSERGAVRTLKDKAGVGKVYLEQLYTFDRPGRDPRGQVVSIAYFALVPKEKLIFGSGRDLQDPELAPVGKLPKLAFDHREIVAYALKRLRYKLEYTNAVFSLLPRYFTFLELQKTYEAILDRKLDKRNFRKKYLALGLIRATTRKLSGGRHRPAKLFEFTDQKATELKRFF